MGACLDNEGTFIELLRDYDFEIDVFREIFPEFLERFGPTITIAGLTGSGKSAVADNLAKQLMLSKRNAGDGYRDRSAKQNVSLNYFSKNHLPEVDVDIDQETIRLARRGNIVITGRLSGFVAGRHSDVKIFVDCEREERIRRVYARENGKFTMDQIAFDTDDRDATNIDTYVKLYGVDARHYQEIYDFIYDTTHMTLDNMLLTSLNNVKEKLKSKGYPIPLEN